MSLFKNTKRFLLALFVLIQCCIFSICSSATESGVNTSSGTALDQEAERASENKDELSSAEEKTSAPPTVRAPKIAPNLDLKSVAPLPEVTPADEIVVDPAPDSAGNIGVVDSTPHQGTIDKFIILGSEVPPGTATRLSWVPDAAISGLEKPTPILVINGAHPGKTLCLTAAIHGDELNGIEIVRRVIYDIDPRRLKGRLIGVPIVNLQGFQRGSRYLPDRRDLNRYFPGKSRGSLASRIAHSLFTKIIKHCDMLVDVHTGSLRRSNLPQLRADMTMPAVARFTEGFDDMAVVHSKGNTGMLRTAANRAGITAVALEVGESMRIQKDKIKQGVHSINSLLERQGMYARLFIWGAPEPVYYRSSWVRAESGGILMSLVKLGSTVNQGESLGTVIDPITNESTEIISNVKGRIIGMAVDQVVMPGFAAYHIGDQATEFNLSQNPEPESDNAMEPADNVDTIQIEDEEMEQLLE